MAASAGFFRIVSLFAAFLFSITGNDTAIYIPGIIVKLYLACLASFKQSKYGFFSFFAWF